MGGRRRKTSKGGNRGRGGEGSSARAMEISGPRMLGVIEYGTLRGVGRRGAGVWMVGGGGVGRVGGGVGLARRWRTGGMLWGGGGAGSAGPSARLLLEWVAAAFLDRQNIRTEKIRSAAKLVTSIRSA